MCMEGTMEGNMEGTMTQMEDIVPKSHDVFDGSRSDDRMTVRVCKFHFNLVLVKVGQIYEGVTGGSAMSLSFSLDG